MHGLQLLKGEVRITRCGNISTVACDQHIHTVHLQRDPAWQPSSDRSTFFGSATLEHDPYNSSQLRQFMWHIQQTNKQTQQQNIQCPFYTFHSEILNFWYKQQKSTTHVGAHGTWLSAPTSQYVLTSFLHRRDFYQLCTCLGSYAEFVAASAGDKTLCNVVDRLVI